MLQTLTCVEVPLNEKKDHGFSILCTQDMDHTRLV